MHNSKKLLLLLLVISWHKGLAQWTRCEKDSATVTFSQLASNAFQVVADADGGAYFIWYSGEANLGKFRAHAQHLDKTGERLWGDIGITAAPESGNQISVKCLPDGVGGLLVFWIESRLGNGLVNLFGQRLSASGQVLWGLGGRHLADCFDYYRYPVVRLSDGMLAVVHNQELAGGQGFSSYLRKLDSDGAFASDLLLEEKHNTDYPILLINDSLGGVFAVWQNDTIKVQYQDEAGDAWTKPLTIWPENTNSPTAPNAYACNAGPDGLFLAWCGYNPNTQGCDLQVQRYDRKGEAGLPLPNVVLPVFGFYLEQMLPARDGGFYFYAFNALHKVSPLGALQWRSEIPVNTHTGPFSFFVETEDSSMLAAYSANGMVFFDASGNILWSKPGNAFNGSSFGLGGVCHTSDGNFITAHFDFPNNDAGSVKSRKLDNSGFQVNSLRDFAGTISGPDSVHFNTPFFLEAQPLDGIIFDWYYSFEPSLGFSRVPEEAFGTDKKILGIEGIYYDLDIYSLVQLGRNCLDTTNIHTAFVLPVLPEGDFTKAEEPLVLGPTLAGMELFVASTFNQAYLVEVWVADVSGRVVDFLEFWVDSGNFYGLYPTDSLEQGVYFFTMQAGGKSINKKFIKIKH